MGEIMLEKRVPVEFKVRLKTREFEGYCSTFTMDQVGDIIEPGSFRKTISERGPKGANKIKVLWDHFEPFGMPVEMREDEHGLYVIGRASDTTENKDRLKYMEEGVVDSMSIGFSIPEGKSWWEEDEDAPFGMLRHITEIKLYEFSPVLFPANEEAVISNVRKHAELDQLIKSFGKDALLDAGRTLPTLDERKLDEVLEALYELKSEVFGTTSGTIENSRALGAGGEPPGGGTSTAGGETPGVSVANPEEVDELDPEVEKALQSALDEIKIESGLLWAFER